MSARAWPDTALGPVSAWPQSLRSAVRVVLSSRYPMLLLWGPDLTQLYNDAYSALIGDKHPAALGMDVRVTLAEGWDVLEPLIRGAMTTGVASWVPALQLLLNRAGYREEAYFSVSHAPARDDTGTTVGVLTVCSEVTEQVVGERRLRLLRDLAVPAIGGTGTDAVAAELCAIIGGQPLDVPFAAVYLTDGCVLRRSAMVGADASALPETVALDGDDADPWRLRAVAGGAASATVAVGGLLTVTGGAWQDPVGTAFAQPLPSADPSQPLGVLLIGVSPSRALDVTYRSFLQLLAQQVAVAVRNERAYQEERDRAAALAELDRVKTDFFTNVSHEFRTPLTLMLGPLADALADHDEPLGEAQRARADTALRNANRLLTLVNELLTFAGTGSGQAVTEPRTLDLARFTGELAGVFRAAVERTGLRLIVYCPPLPRPVAVDPGHWEKIVTNLISNALKFTFTGEIRVLLESDATEVRLKVTDTGIGIDDDELPHLFERFHRVRGTRSRSHEGTGIGLALVRELTRLAGGDVSVTSVSGEGTTFTVALPWTAVAGATSDDAPDVSTLADVRTAASIAANWDGGESIVSGTGDVRILVADDNADMRSYLARLLTAEGWRVETVGDGEAALHAIRRIRPDLLITDVMMPRLDGFALVRRLRTDETTRALPIVMLSARAGQESGVEGLAAGADDYVVKPFSARELIARVRGTLRLANVRATGAGPDPAPTDAASLITAGWELEQAFQSATDLVRAITGASAAVTVLDGGTQPLRFASQTGAETTGDQLRAEITGSPAGFRRGEITLHVTDPGRATGAFLAAAAEVLARLAHNDRQTGHDQHAPVPDGWELHLAPPRAGGWTDVTATGDGDLLVSVGESSGPGLSAMVTAELLRAAVRAYAIEEPSPARLVARLVPAAPDSLPATLLVVTVDPRTGRFSWAGAGHPGPAHVVPGVPGQRLTGDLLGHGEQLVLYSGDNAAVTVRRGPAVAIPADTELPDLDVTWVYPLEAGASSAARRDLQTILPDDVDADLLYDLQVAVTEAINNAVEHAQQPSRPEVRVRMLAAGGLLRVEIQDFGGWRARPPARDRGRGAILMNAYGDVRVTATSAGTRVTIERRWIAPDHSGGSTATSA
ncbi:Signal transduction histidine kinase [Actinoplanes derwentensis]|uniref:histidine kinase n=2 Tax=Actinoplanes derwentensis TaxID=113562 RepID=A0A1H1VBC0_9ACTN|nr:Signal transduction histidine kinase [Actinoplanes derwentensis]